MLRMAGSAGRCRDRGTMTEADGKTSGRPAGSLPGISLMLLSVFLFSSMDSLIKSAARDYPTGQIIFFRNIVAFVPVMLFLVRSGSMPSLRSNHIGGHLLRGIVGVSAMFCFFLALGLLPLADVIALSMAGPIFLTALSVPLLGERVGIRRWSAVIVGFVGILIMVRPGSGVFQAQALIPLAGAVFYALAMTLIRKLSRVEPAGTIVFYFTVFATIVGLATAPLALLAPDLADRWTWPDSGGWLVLCGIGLIGGVAQLTLTYAFKLAPVATIAPFEYTALVFGVLLGLVFWDEFPDRYIIAGAAVVIASGLYILYREAKLRRLERSAAPPV